LLLHTLCGYLLRHGLGRGRRGGFGGGGGDDGTVELWRHDGRANGNGGVAKGTVRAMRHKAKGIGTVAEQITERRFEFKLHLGQFLGRGRRHERQGTVVGLLWSTHLVVLAHHNRCVFASRRDSGRQGGKRVEDLTSARKGLIVGRLDTVLQEDGIVVGQVEDERIGQNDCGLPSFLAVNAQRLERSATLGTGFHGRFQNEKGTILGLTQGGDTRGAQVLADLVLKLGIRALVGDHELVTKAWERTRNGSVVVLADAATRGVKVRKEESTARQLLVRLGRNCIISMSGTSSSSQCKEAIIPLSIATHVARAQFLVRRWNVVPRLGVASRALVPGIPARRVQSTLGDNLHGSLGGRWSLGTLPRPTPKEGIGNGSSGLGEAKVIESILIVGRSGQIVGSHGGSVRGRPNETGTRFHDGMVRRHDAGLNHIKVGPRQGSRQAIHGHETVNGHGARRRGLHERGRTETLAIVLVACRDDGRGRGGGSPANEQRGHGASVEFHESWLVVGWFGQRWCVSREPNLCAIVCGFVRAKRAYCAEPRKRPVQ
jgi:hypothetical protein